MYKEELKMIVNKQINKQGVSLITLVVTIIIMTILAGAVILMLSNTSIFDKANSAVSEYNDKQQQMMDTLNCLDDWESCVVREGKVKDFISNKDISKKFGYEANGVTDWNVFYVDEANNNLYIIAETMVERTTLSAYINVKDLTETELDRYRLFQVGNGDSYGNDKYVLKDISVDGRFTLIGNKAVGILIRNYTKYANTEEYGEEYIKGALGGPTMELFVESWNALLETPKMWYYTTEDSWGYASGFKDDVRLFEHSFYFLDATNGYWLASPDASYETFVSAAFDKYVESGKYTVEKGVRPVVCINMDAPAIKKGKEPVSLVKLENN